MINRPNRIRIDYFKTDGIPGGSQAWFTDYWMRIGGCAALAACDMTICLAKNHGLRDLCSFNSRKINREDYIRLGMIMKNYIRPRVGGVVKTSIYTRGLGRYLNERGYRAEFMECQGKEDYDRAVQFVREALSLNLPVAYLMLLHSDKRFEHLNWHWFTITGMEIKNGRVKLTYHTYGGANTVDFSDLWHTGRIWKGGMVAIRSIRSLSGSRKSEVLGKE